MAKAVGLGISEVKANEVVGQLTLSVSVTGMTVAKFRVWLGCQVLKLAALIIGCQLEVALKTQERGLAPVTDPAVPPRWLHVDDVMSGRAAITPEQMHRIRVMVDGVHVLEVVAYDCDQGWVERYRKGPDGLVIVTGDSLETERVTGTVTAEYRTKA